MAQLWSSEQLNNIFYVKKAEIIVLRKNCFIVLCNEKAN